LAAAAFFADGFLTVRFAGTASSSPAGASSAAF
jgi:hypothetical protein